jgi:hypothetical protein
VAACLLADHGLPFLHSAGDQMEQCTRLLEGDRTMLIYSGTAMGSCEGPKMATRGGEWEPQISFEIFSHCPKITAKHKLDPEEEYPSQLVTRVPKMIPRNGKKLTQQTKHKSELK